MAAAHLSRAPSPPGSVHRVGRIVVDEHAGAVYVDGSNVAATPQQVAALTILARNSPGWVSRAEFTEVVWQRRSIDPGTFRIFLMRLSQRLGKAQDDLVRDRKHGLSLRRLQKM